MKNAVILLFVLLNSAGLAVAQDSLQVQPSPSLPQGQYGTPGTAVEEKEDRTPITISEIPARMKETLDGNEKYKGWQDGQIYFDRSTDQYLVHIVESNATRTYRFDKSGASIHSGSGEPGMNEPENKN